MLTPADRSRPGLDLNLDLGVAGMADDPFVADRQVFAGHVKLCSCHDQPGGRREHSDEQLAELPLVLVPVQSHAHHFVPVSVRPYVIVRWQLASACRCRVGCVQRRHGCSLETGGDDQNLQWIVPTDLHRSAGVVTVQ